MKPPTLTDLTQRLKDKKTYIENAGLEVRLQVTEDAWRLYYGDPQTDNDHTGKWGTSYLTRHSNCRQVARELLDTLE